MSSHSEPRWISRTNVAATAVGELMRTALTIPRRTRISQGISTMRMPQIPRISRSWAA